MNITHPWFEQGGPAFPLIIAAGNGHGEIQFKGMSLRDYFAAAVLSSHKYTVDDRIQTGSQVIARWAYEVADAMLKEREKT